MSEKADRYIGLVFWLLLVSWLWLNIFDEFLYIDKSASWEFIETVFGFFGFTSSTGDVSFETWTLLAWGITLLAGISLSWEFRASPMRVIRRITNAFHKSV
jgi:hypothetical protein